MTPCRKVKDRKMRRLLVATHYLVARSAKEKQWQVQGTYPTPEESW